MDDHASSLKSEEIIENGYQLLIDVYDLYKEGVITDGERYNKSIDVACRVAEQVKQDEKASSPVWSAVGRCFGHRTLWRTIGTEGFLTGTFSAFHETPVWSNLSKGLSCHEAFMHAGNERTQNHRQWLMRNAGTVCWSKLISALGDLRVTVDDCGTTKHRMANIDDSMPILGRTLAAPVQLPGQSEPVVEAGLIDKAKLRELLEVGAQKIPIRWASGCAELEGICSACYGLDPSTLSVATAGSPVGAMAARILSELLAEHPDPFPIIFVSPGGAARSTMSADSSDTTVHHHRLWVQEIAGEKKEWIVMAPGGRIQLRAKGIGVVREEDLPMGATLKYGHGEVCPKGKDVAEWDPFRVPVLSWHEGVISTKNLKWGEGVCERYRTSTRVVLEAGVVWVGAHPYVASPGAHLVVQEGERATPGTVLLTIPRSDLLDGEEYGVERFFELVETTRPREPCIIARKSGTVTAIVENNVFMDDGTEYRLQRNWSHLKIGDYLEAGDRVDGFGEPDPFEMLEIIGPDRFSEDLVRSLFAVFWPRPSIAPVHLELLVKQMLQGGQLWSLSELAGLRSSS